MKFFKLFCSIIVLLTGLNSRLSAQNEADTDTLIIMPLGDSIMNDGRSRGGLWNKLVDDGYVLDYVGSQFQRGIIPDPDHEGVGGATIQDVADKINGLLEQYHPEFIVLMIGTNDIAWYFDETGEQIAERHNALIQQIYDNSPVEDLAMLVSTIPPVTPKDRGSQEMEEKDRSVLVANYNEAMKVKMQERIDAGENIVIADVFTPMFEDTAAYLNSDGVHPNAEGYEVIAEVWYQAFIDLLEKNDETPTEIQDPSLPDKFGLEQNYPNPFNPVTTIEYSIEKPGVVSLEVFNVQGQKVATIVNESQPAGNYQQQWNASDIASGIYYYRLESSGQTLTRKMTLIK